MNKTDKAVAWNFIYVMESALTGIYIVLVLCEIFSLFIEKLT